MRGQLNNVIVRAKLATGKSGEWVRRDSCQRYDRSIETPTAPAALREPIKAGQNYGQKASPPSRLTQYTEDPTMVDVSTFEDISLPADTVWEVIGDFGDFGDFGGIRKWAVLVKSESVEDSPCGKVRTLVMPEDRVVMGRLVVQSQYSYTYAMVGRADMAD
jgi:hypothetical protein